MGKKTGKRQKMPKLPPLVEVWLSLLLEVANGTADDNTIFAAQALANLLAARGEAERVAHMVTMYVPELFDLKFDLVSKIVEIGGEASETTH